MEQNGKNKFYLRLSFYTIICTVIYAALVIFMYSHNMLLRNKPNIIISFIILILVGFSIFQNIVTKTKGNNIKMIILAVLFVLVFAITNLGNKYIIDNMLSKEVIKEFGGEKYIVMQKETEEYYFKIYSDYVRGSIPKYSISHNIIYDKEVKYITTTVVEFSDNGSVINTTSDSRVESGV